MAQRVQKISGAKTASGIGLGNAVNTASPGYTPRGGLAQPGAAGRIAAAENAKAATQKAAQAAGGVSAALPWDSIAEGKAANAGLGYKNTVDQVAANRALGLQEFGLDPGYDDYKNNPYSQAAILQHNHESNAAGITTTAGQAGYSGQTANAQGIEIGRTNQAHQTLVNEEERAKANWTAEEKAAEIAQREADNEAQEGAVQRAVEATPPEVPLPERASRPKQAAPQGKKWAYNSENNRWHLVKA